RPGTQTRMLFSNILVSLGGSCWSHGWISCGTHHSIFDATRRKFQICQTGKEDRMFKKDLIIVNAKVTTLDRGNPLATAVAIRDGKFIAVGTEAEVRAAAPEATVIDAAGRRLIPGLIDSHTHVIRGGLNYNVELRWDGVPSLSEAMAMLRAQVDRTPAPQWVVWWVVSPSINSPRSACRPLTNSMRWPPIPRSSSCIFMTGHC